MYSEYLTPLLGRWIRMLLFRHRGNVAKAARLFNGARGPPCHRRTFERIMKRLGIDPGEYRGKGEDDGR